MQSVVRAEILQSCVLISELSEQYLECGSSVAKIPDLCVCMARSAHSYVFGLRAIGYTGPWQCVILDLVRDPSVHAGFNGGSGIPVRAPALHGGYYVGNSISNGIGMSTRNLTRGRGHHTTSPVVGCKWELIDEVIRGG